MNRIKYIDALKFAAIFSIVILHMCMVWLNTGFLGQTFFQLKEIVRFGVPLFLMITGCLIFKKEINIKEFFKKKTIRIIYPLVFFIIIALFFNYGRGNPLILFWYCWMIIGVYISIPIVNIFIQNAKSYEIEYFLIFFFISSLIYNLSYISHIQIAIDLGFFLGPISFVILGYYLSCHEFKLSSKKIILINLCVYILISIFKVYYNDVFDLNYDNILFNGLNFSLSQIIQSISVFLFIKNLYDYESIVKTFLESKYVGKFIESISRSSYGIYMVHLILLRVFLQDNLSKIHLSGTQTALIIMGFSCLLLLVSWIIILILSKIPFINKFSGYA